jgi:hypothetical protein
MEKLHMATLALARASSGNPVVSTATIILFYLMFNQCAATVEHLIWGERLEHWLDPVFQCFFIAYSAYTVWCCAIINSHDKS